MSGDDGKTTDGWWVDYLENEMVPDLEKDLELLLRHSEEDRDTFENIRLLREWLRASDPIAKWPIDERLTRVRCKVMREIEREEYHAPERNTNSLSV